MEKVFEAHIHHLVDMPLCRTADIFKREFDRTSTEGGCFLSIPHGESGEPCDFKPMQNLKMLALKEIFGESFYAFAGLIHPLDYSDKRAVRESFLNQVREFMSVGFDGIKMLEGYPSLLKARNIPIDHSVYDGFYGFMEENGYPITIHIANPRKNWDKTKITPQLVAEGRVYDESFPTKDEITSQLFRVLEKFPRLKIATAHFGFLMGEKENAERFLGDYPNTSFDITPGGEQYAIMLAEWDYWSRFIERYQDRIYYGTDFYAFKDDNLASWERCFLRRPTLVRNFFETDGEFDYVGTSMRGVKLKRELRDKIYRENARRVLGLRRPIDKAYALKEAEYFLKNVSGESEYAKEDAELILKLFSQK